MPHFSASSTVNVKYRPEILVHGLSVVYVVLGDNIGLHCNYKANPAVTAKVTWYRNGKVLKHKNIDVRNITQDGAEISINNGKFSHPFNHMIHKGYFIVSLHCILA